jgi:hypothetical protein
MPLEQPPRGQAARTDRLQNLVEAKARESSPSTPHRQDAVRRPDSWRAFTSAAWKSAILIISAGARKRPFPDFAGAPPQESPANRSAFVRKGDNLCGRGCCAGPGHASLSERRASRSHTRCLFGVWNTDDANGLRLIHRYGPSWLLAADMALSGAPSVFFDAVAIFASEAGIKPLLKNSAAVDWVRDAFGHLKVIGHTAAAQPLFAKAGLADDLDEGVIELDGLASVGQYIKAAKHRRPKSPGFGCRAHPSPARHRDRRKRMSIDGPAQARRFRSR